MITNSQSGTNVFEIAEDIYRINTPVALPDGSAFNFNQYLIKDESPLLFHTGLRGLFPLVSEAIASVIPIESLRYVALSHFEADECGALNDFLAAAPAAEAVCGTIAAMVSIGDFAIRPPKALADEETLTLGRHVVRWLDSPQVPHGWDCGLLMDETTDTLFCGDLFTQGGPGATAVTQSDILGPSEAFRKAMDYYAHAPQTRAQLERLAGYEPKTLACMHGSAWRGNGAGLLRALATELSGSARAA
jgi:flavorubredoxin